MGDFSGKPLQTFGPLESDAADDIYTYADFLKHMGLFTSRTTMYQLTKYRADQMQITSNEDSKIECTSPSIEIIYTKFTESHYCEDVSSIMCNGRI